MRRLIGHFFLFALMTLMGCEQPKVPQSDSSINQIYLEHKTLYTEIIKAITQLSNVPGHIHIAKYTTHIEATPKFDEWKLVERYVLERMKGTDIITSDVYGVERNFYFTVQRQGLATSGGFIKGLLYAPNGTSIKTLPNLNIDISTHSDLKEGKNYYTRINENWFIFLRFSK